MKISVVLPTLDCDGLPISVGSLSEADEIILVRDKDCPLTECYNRGYNLTHGDIILQTNDRLRFDPGWRKKVEEAFKKINNYGVVSFFELICMAGCLSRDYIEKEQGGYLYWPEYFHYWGDREISARAAKKSCYSQIEGTAHWIKVERLINRRPNADLQDAWDRETYAEREKQDFPLSFTRLEEMKKIW